MPAYKAHTHILPQRQRGAGHDAGRPARWSVRGASQAGRVVRGDTREDVSRARVNEIAMLV